MSQPTVTLYTKDHCQQCNATKRKLDKEGVVYSVVDCSSAYVDIAPAEQREEALRNVAAIKELGHQQMPVIVVGNPGQADIHWSGFQPEEIMRHCKAA